MAKTPAPAPDPVAVLAVSDIFDASQRATLRALCDTFIPGLEAPDGDEGAAEFWERAASHMGVAEGVEVGLFGAALPQEIVAGLRGLLDALAANGMAAEAPQAAREQIVNGFSDTDPDALAGIATLRAIAGSIFYAAPDPATGRNPNWDAIGFPGPIATPPADHEAPLRVRHASGADETVEADVCVVGSGAGGGVVAAELAAAGRSVVVLEAGGYYDDGDFDGLELSAYQRLYLNGGPFPTADGQVSIVAGSGVGGGTVVNWTNCLRMTDHVRAEWASEHGLTDLAESGFDAHLDAVFERLGVNDECSDLNGPHQRLQQGCEELGYDFALITRNTYPETYAPESAAYMGFGDPSGSKQSTAKTYLVDAQTDGAEIFAGARAQRVLLEGGRAAGVEALWSDDPGAETSLTVRAPIVVVACGSIESPALLLRSGLGGPAVGEHLRLHPTVAVTAYYDEAQNWMWGPPQAALSHQFADTGDGYGFLIESAQATTGLFSGAIPWRSGADHKRRMREWAHAAALIALVRERGEGSVQIDADGRAVVHYPITDELDQANLKQGVEQLVRIHAAAGAREIVGSGLRAPDWARGDDLEAFITALNELEIKPREYVTFSAHQMGSCRMGRDPATSVANPWGELHDTPGVWIGDASAFPSASGTNPMATIMALARRTAKAIAAS